MDELNRQQFAHDTIQHLDRVLEFIAVGPFSHDGISLESMAEILIPKITEPYLKVYLDKLYEDGLIDYTTETQQVSPKGTKDVNIYSIKLDGRIKYLEGGYTGEITRKNAGNIRLDKIDSELRANRNWTLWLTGVLTFSALATLVYYCVDLYWKYGWFHNSFYNCVSILSVVISASVFFLLRKTKHMRKKLK